MLPIKKIHAIARNRLATTRASRHTALILDRKISVAPMMDWIDLIYFPLCFRAYADSKSLVLHVCRQRPPVERRPAGFEMTWTAECLATLQVPAPCDSL